MLIALAFAHFSSKLLLKEQMIIPVKKTTLNNAGPIDAKLIDFSEICQKKSSEIGCFLLIVSWRSFPPKFPVKWADFSKNLPLKILWNLTFFHKNPAKSNDFPANFESSPAKSGDFSANFDFFLAKSADFFVNLPLKILSNLTFFPLKSREVERFSGEFWLFSCEIGRFFRKFAPENPAKFCFFSVKYQKPCL